MAPVATNEKAEETQQDNVLSLKSEVKSKLFNPFFGIAEGEDDDYEYNRYKVRSRPPASPTSIAYDTHTHCLHSPCGP